MAKIKKIVISKLLMDSIRSYSFPIGAFICLLLRARERQITARLFVATQLDRIRQKRSLRQPDRVLRVGL